MAKTSKTPVKKQSQPVKKRVDPKKVLFLVLLLLIVAAAIYVLWGYAYRTLYVQPREARINQIYDSLNISDDYQLTGQKISGEKKVYEGDKGRSYSSVKEYVHGATVSDTFGALDRAIRQAGYTFVSEPYPGSTFKQYHYKSDRGEYIRLSVSSKPRNDATFNFAKMNPGVELPASIIEADPNAGPASVTIKVNLDDNNE